MSAIRLSRPIRRLAALALLALPPLLLLLIVVAPWQEAREAQAARLDRARLLEARARATEARGPALAAELAALRGALAGVAEPVVPGATHALAGAELQRRLREAAARHGGAVTSLETLPEGRAGSDAMVGVRARLQADPAGLRGLLAELEAGQALLQVPALVLAQAGGSAAVLAARRGGGGGGAAPPLEVQIELRGLRRAEAGAVP